MEQLFSRNGTLLVVRRTRDARYLFFGGNYGVGVRSARCVWYNRHRGGACSGGGWLVGWYSWSNVFLDPPKPVATPKSASWIHVCVCACVYVCKCLFIYLCVCECVPFCSCLYSHLSLPRLLNPRLLIRDHCELVFSVKSHGCTGAWAELLLYFLLLYIPVKLDRILHLRPLQYKWKS